MPTLDEHQRARRLQNIARQVCVASIRCRIIGPASLALDLSSTRSGQVMRFELKRFEAAQLIDPVGELSDEDVETIAHMLPTEAKFQWEKALVGMHLG